ncbi:hypothetical protein UC34_01175 [Pandoraea vervacti]|uniref:Uncharacterized protein n=1 Tax=Pandoraea vervacti TaxID=656178 RepID=A0ABM5SU68_9BURK|nr:hypothetical protein UC34_01175 [Pandoraea vervacti]
MSKTVGVGEPGVADATDAVHAPGVGAHHARMPGARLRISSARHDAIAHVTQNIEKTTPLRL